MIKIPLELLRSAHRSEQTLVKTSFNRCSPRGRQDWSALWDISTSIHANEIGIVSPVLGISGGVMTLVTVILVTAMIDILFPYRHTAATSAALGRSHAPGSADPSRSRPAARFRFLGLVGYGTEGNGEVSRLFGKSEARWK